MVNINEKLDNLVEVTQNISTTDVVKEFVVVLQEESDFYLITKLKY